MGRREYLKLNKNILASFAASITASAVFAQLISDQADYLNTTYTLMVDHLVYFSTFGGLYYTSNRKKYFPGASGTDKARLHCDLLKIIASLGISEAVYTAVRWLLQYYLLAAGYDPYLASAVSQGISIAVYIVVMNLNVKMTRLYSDGS